MTNGRVRHASPRGDVVRYLPAARGICARPTAIALSPNVAARHHLRALVRETPLSIRELAVVFGVNSRTLERQLAGRGMGRQRRYWYQRIRRVEIADDEIVLVMSRVGRTRKY